jgi:CheY-like chemotaxis protein
MKSKKPILLVEDDRVDAMTIQRAMRDLKVTNTLVHRNNGLEGLDYLKDKASLEPCIILLDLNMPKMNGIEFLAVIKKDDFLKKIPVIVLTTSNAEKDKLESFSLGIAGYMIKPVDYKQFVDVIREIEVYWTLSELPD